MPQHYSSYAPHRHCEIELKLSARAFLKLIPLAGAFSLPLSLSHARSRLPLSRFLLLPLRIRVDRFFSFMRLSRPVLAHRFGWLHVGFACMCVRAFLFAIFRTSILRRTAAVPNVLKGKASLNFALGS
jgi:hypothetical protein